MIRFPFRNIAWKETREVLAVIRCKSSTGWDKTTSRKTIQFLCDFLFLYVNDWVLNFNLLVYHKLH